MENKIESLGVTQRHLLRELLRYRDGMTIDGLAAKLEITRNAVRQHLTVLERDGHLTKGETKPTGGRPEQFYVLTAAGRESFPRQYSWFSEMLLQLLEAQVGSDKLKSSLAAMGRQIGATMKTKMSEEGKGSARRIGSIAAMMTEIGYEAVASTKNGIPHIEAHNCVFHQLALKYPEVCSFDLALLAESSGSQIEHRTCMIKGDDACRFEFHSKKTIMKKNGHRLHKRTARAV
jgi:predicted ArsR family transcriptional regulator